jgi:hypothetical protein
MRSGVRDRVSAAAPERSTRIAHGAESGTFLRDKPDGRPPGGQDIAFQGFRPPQQAAGEMEAAMGVCVKQEWLRGGPKDRPATGTPDGRRATDLQVSRAQMQAPSSFSPVRALRLETPPAVEADAARLLGSA